MAHRHILDNQTNTVADYLRKHLEKSNKFRLVSAYLSIYGYKKLADALPLHGENGNTRMCCHSWYIKGE